MVQFMALFSLKPSNQERRMCSELGWFFFLSFASKTKKKDSFSLAHWCLVCLPSAYNDCHQSAGLDQRAMTTDCWRYLICSAINSNLALDSKSNNTVRQYIYDLSFCLSECPAAMVSVQKNFGPQTNKVDVSIKDRTDPLRFTKKMVDGLKILILANQGFCWYLQLTVDSWQLLVSADTCAVSLLYKWSSHFMVKRW